MILRKVIRNYTFDFIRSINGIRTRKTLINITFFYPIRWIFWSKMINGNHQTKLEER